jgi:hypothetical protein
LKRTPATIADFEEFTSSLIGHPVSHIWRGYGSAIFFEFGSLRPHFISKDRLLSNPNGDWTLTIEWSWRIEGKRRVWCGSWSEESRRSRVLSTLLNARVESVALTGRLPEIDIALSNGLHVVSFMTAEGDPEWGLIRRGADGTVTCIGSVAGRLELTNEIRPQIDT